MQVNTAIAANDFETIALGEFDRLLKKTPLEIRKIVFDIVHDNIDDILHDYDDYISLDSGLNSIVVSSDEHGEIAAVFREWVLSLFDVEYDDVRELVAKQGRVGEMLARIGFPAYAVARSPRKLQEWLLGRLFALGLPPATRERAALYVVNAVGISVELRTLHYFSIATEEVHAEDAFRLMTLTTNLAMERERQRAFLVEWERNLLKQFYQAPGQPLPRLGRSDFGIWVGHKAYTIFETSTELGVVSDLIGAVDTVLLPELENAPYDDRGRTGAAILAIEGEIEKIKFHMGSLFESCLEIENGRDSLTRLLNRRFVDVVLSREIAMHKRDHGTGFAVLMIDIDRFKAINDTHGHVAGDEVIRKVAAIIAETVRSCDFVFRYGGEEILAVLIEIEERVALHLAEKIRRKVAEMPIHAADGTDIRVTVSIGMAPAGDRLDYRHIIDDADAALYAAKLQGRNRVVAHCRDKEPAMGDLPS